MKRYDLMFPCDGEPNMTLYEYGDYVLVDEALEIIEKLQGNLDALGHENDVLKKANDILKNEVDDLEQQLSYIRILYDNKDC